MVSAIRMQVGGRGALDSSRSLGMTVEPAPTGEGVGWRERAGTRPAPTGEGANVVFREFGDSGRAGLGFSPRRLILGGRYDF